MGIVTIDLLFSLGCLIEVRDLLWSQRSQCDRMVFSATWRSVLESIPDVSFWQDSVVDILIKDDIVVGVRLA